MDAPAFGLAKNPTLFPYMEAEFRSAAREGTRGILLWLKNSIHLDHDIDLDRLSAALKTYGYEAFPIKAHAHALDEENCHGHQIDLSKANLSPGEGIARSVIGYLMAKIDRGYPGDRMGISYDFRQPFNDAIRHWPEATIAKPVTLLGRADVRQPESISIR